METPSVREFRQPQKLGSRARKLGLIEAMNPDWQDLYDGLGDAPLIAAACGLAMTEGARIAASNSPSLRGGRRRGNPAAVGRGDHGGGGGCVHWIAAARRMTEVQDVPPQIPRHCRRREAAAVHGAD